MQILGHVVRKDALIPKFSESFPKSIVHNTAAFVSDGNENRG